MNQDILIEYERLKQKYDKGRITVKQAAVELNMSESTIRRRIKKGINIPDFQKGEGKNGRIYFAIIDIAKYIVKSIKTIVRFNAML